MTNRLWGRLNRSLLIIAAAYFSMVLTAESRAQTVVRTGIDTTLPSGTGLNGPDLPHGAAGGHPEGLLWEWDGSDGGGLNQGLIWFNIPQSILDGFTPSSSAVMRLHIDNEGDTADLHRMTVDWLSSPDGGDNVTFNNIPGGPGIVPGTNAETTSNASSGAVPAALVGTFIEIDVSTDVRAWAGGASNFGWGFVPAAGTGNGVGVDSFEAAIDIVPQLVFTGVAFTSGDVNKDGVTDLDDFSIIRDNLLSGTLPEEGDLNGDLSVDFDDFRIWKSVFVPPGAPGAVPEPAGLVLVLVGGLLLWGGKRRARGG